MILRHSKEARDGTSAVGRVAHRPRPDPFGDLRDSEDPDKPAPFDPSHSWAFAAAHVAERPARTFGVTVSWLTALLFAAAGIALLVDSSLWESIAVCAAALGLLLKGLFFHPWLILGLLIDVGVLWAATAGWPDSLA